MTNHKSMVGLNLKISKWLIPQFIIFFILGLDIKFIICFFFIVLHEISHLVVVKLMHIKTGEFKLHCLGATLEIKDYSNLSLKEQIIICLAGPVFNILMSITFFIAFYFLKNSFLLLIVEVNLVLAIFNIMPMYPLDGFKLLVSLFSLKLSYVSANKVSNVISYIVNIILIIVSIIFLIHKNISGIFIIIICFFSIFKTFKDRKNIMYTVMDNLFKKQNLIKRKKYMKTKAISIYWEQSAIDLLKILEKDKFHIFYILDENMGLKYILREDEFIEILNNYGNIKLKDYYNTRNK
ncbi:MAG: peptidase M50 [Clostridium perfringens]|nr:peptidase M50 [Clostridium perfringens]